MIGAAGRTAYVEVVVDVGDDAAEALTNFLWEQGAVGVVEETLLAGPARLRAFFPATPTTDALAVRVDAYVAGLRALGLAAGPRARVAPVADADWAAAWREHFRPVAVGKNLLIAPPWDTPAASDRLVLTMFFIDGLSYQQIASQAGIPMGTIATVISRSRLKLKDLLKSHGVDG